MIFLLDILLIFFILYYNITIFNHFLLNFLRDGGRGQSVGVDDQVRGLPVKRIPGRHQLLHPLLSAVPRQQRPGVVAGQAAADGPGLYPQVDDGAQPR